MAAVPKIKIPESRHGNGGRNPELEVDPKGFTSEKSVKTHHPSQVPNFAHGVLVRFTYIGKDCSLAHLYYQFKYNIYLSFLVGDGFHDDVGACETSDAPLFMPV